MQTWACNFIKKETPSQVFSCEFCKISKSSCFYRAPLAPASEEIVTIHQNLAIGNLEPLLLKRTISSCDSYFEKNTIQRWLDMLIFLILSWRRPLSYRSQSTDLQTGFVIKELISWYWRFLLMLCWRFTSKWITRFRLNCWHVNIGQFFKLILFWFLSQKWKKMF